MSQTDESPVVTTTSPVTSTVTTMSGSATTSLTAVFQIRPPDFRPGSDLSQFLDTFSVLAEANGWSEAQKKAYLTVAFPPTSPFQTVCLETPPSATFSALVSDLKRVVTTHQKQTKLAEYEQRTMRDGESVGEYERSLRHLFYQIAGSNAYPEVDGRYIHKFISGLPSQWRGKVAERLYDRLSLALASAQRLEIAERLHASSLPVSCAQFSPLMLGAATPLPNFQFSKSDISELRGEVEGLKHQVQDLSQMFQSLLELQKKQIREVRRSRHSSSSDSDREHPRRAGSGNSRRSGSRTRFASGDQTKYCRYCRKSGHLIEQCRLRPLCPICSQRGHSPKFCPQNSGPSGQFGTREFQSRARPGNGSRPA